MWCVYVVYVYECMWCVCFVCVPMCVYGVFESTCVSKVCMYVNVSVWICECVDICGEYVWYECVSVCKKEREGEREGGKEEEITS